MIIYPQLGWQEEVEIPASIIHAYFFFNNKGFDKFIYSSSEILELVKNTNLICRSLICFLT